MRMYNRAKAAAKRARDRGPGWKPSKITFHYQTQCDGKSHICTGCEERKSLDAFYNNLESPCGKDPRCKQCKHLARVDLRNTHPIVRMRNDRRSAINKMGLTEIVYSYMWYQQNRVCALCEEPETAKSSTGNIIALAVDHDHACCPQKTACRKCIRGLLCKSCNLILGRIEVKPKLIDKFQLTEYLQRRPLLHFEVLPMEMDYETLAELDGDEFTRFRMSTTLPPRVKNLYTGQFEDTGAADLIPRD